MGDMRRYLFIPFIIMFLGKFAYAEPVISTEGLWVGTCARGTLTLNANLLVDQLSGRLNGKPISGLKKDLNTISFQETNKTFSGKFSNQTNTLTGLLSVGNKAADCNLTRKVEVTGRLCVTNAEKTSIWVRADFADGSPGDIVRLLGGEAARLSGDKNGGKLCWGTSDFGKGPCPRSLPANAYSC